MTFRTMAAAGVLLVASMAVPALAEGRPDTRRMTCAQASHLVRQYGAVVMTTGRHTYQRFVATRAFCDPWEVVRPATAPTRDDPQCVLGICQEPLFRLRPFGWDD